MCKKLIYLITFVLVLGLAGNALADDLAVPYWAGAPGSTYAIWTFDEDSGVADTWYPEEYIGDEENHMSADNQWTSEGPGSGNPDFAAVGNPPGGSAVWSDTFQGRQGVIGSFGEFIGIINNWPRDEAKFKRIRIQMTYYTVEDPYALFVECETADEGDWNYWPSSRWYDWTTEEYELVDWPVTDLGGGWYHVFMEIDTHEGGEQGLMFNPGAEVFFIGGEDISTDIDQVIVDTICYAGDEPPSGPGRGEAVQATNPSPAGDDVCPKVVLSWTAAPGAVEHDVYFGTSEADVTDANTTVQLGVLVSQGQTENYYPTVVGTLDLDFGQTYYWRIDEVNDLDPNSPWTGNVWQFTTEPYAYQLSGDKITATASSSDSPDEGPENTVNGSGLVGDLHSYDVYTDMWLSGDELAGKARIKYEFDKVYKLHEMWVWNYNGRRESDFGFKDVTIEYSTDGTSWTPLAGVPDFNQAPEDPDYAHNTTVDFSVAAKDVNIIANSNWESNPKPPTNYGLSEVRFYYIPVHPREESPESGTTIDGTDVVLSWRAGREAVNHNVYISENFGDVNDRSISPVIIPDDGSCRASYGPLSLELDKIYYWRVDEVNMAEAYTTWEGDVWSFTVAPIPDTAFARDPNPDDEETGVVIDPNLSWTAGDYAASVDGHRVYFDLNEQKVIDRSDCDVNGVSTTDPCYSITGPLDLGKTYYWAVDEINVAGPDPYMWEGDLWSFTVIDHLVVDDIEAYTDRMSIITVWRDGGTGGGTSGSNVTVSTESDDRDPRLFGDGPPWPVRDSEAMQFAYDNDGSITIYVQPYNPYTYSVDVNYYSEIEVSTSGPNSLEVDPNWTRENVKALSLWFYGDADNDIEPMWVKLTDQGGSSGKVTYGDYGENPNDINDPSWQEWNIALSDFGVDLTHVNDIAIGFGDESNRTTPGGSGVVFFDDIRLYPTRCVLSLRSPDFARVDYVEDCVVNYKEVEVMADDWLMSDVIPTSDPGTANLVAWYQFEENANDSVSPYYDGDPCGTPTYSTDSIEGSYAIEFDGVEDAVNVGSVGIDGNTPRTISCWAKATSMTIADWANVFGFCPDIHAGHQYFDIEKWGYGDDYAIHVHGWEEDIIPLDLEWHHLAVTYDGTTIRWYGNGKLVGSDVRELDTIDYVRMGYRPTDDAWFPGLVDDARIYNRALSDPEVAYLADTTPLDGELYVPLVSPADLYEGEPEGSRYINFKDFAVLANSFLDEQLVP